MPKNKSIGVNEIARLSGVSAATVSRVFNNPEMVTEETKIKVLSTAKEHNYVYLQRSKKNAADTQKNIMVFIYDIKNPYHVELFSAINRRAFENDFAVTLCNAKGDHALEKRYYDYCQKRNTCAMIYTGDTGINLGDKDFINYDFPIIQIDREQLTHPNCYSIVQDNRKGSALLVDYLYKLNHRRIGYIAGDLTMKVARERLEGFSAAMKEVGLEVPEEYIKEGFFSVQGGTKSFDYFYSMSNAPTAIIAANDLSAQGFIMRANSLGVKIPDEFSVCGFDGVDTSAFYPPITSIKQNIPRIVNLIFEIIENKQRNSRKFVLDISMSMGATCHKI